MIDALIGAINDFADWLFGLVKDAFDAIWDLLGDAAVWVVDEFLIGLAALISAIPTPDFLTAYSLNGILSGVHPMVGYFALGLHIPEGFAILGSAVAFRLVRKALTLFQW